MLEGNNSSGVDGLPVSQQEGNLLTQPEAGGVNGLIISVIKYEAPVGKRYELGNGKVVGSQSSRSAKAVGETVSFPSFEDFATWRKELTAEGMLVSGTFDAVGTVPVVYKGNEALGEVSASKEFLAHRERPGVLIIDIDYRAPRTMP